MVMCVCICYLHCIKMGAVNADDDGDYVTVACWCEWWTQTHLLTLLSAAEFSAGVVTASDKDRWWAVFLVPISLYTTWYQPVGRRVDQICWRQRGWLLFFFSVLYLFICLQCWRCWLDVRKSIRPVNQVLAWLSVWIDWLSRVYCPTKHTIGHIRDGFLRIKWPNRQCQSTEGSSGPKVGFNPTRCTSPCYNATHACNNTCTKMNLAQWNGPSETKPNPQNC